MRARNPGDIRRSDRAKSALALAVGRNGFLQLWLAEIGPELVGDVELGVAQLPEQEVRQAQLADGADEEIRVRVVARVEVLSEDLVVDHGLVQVAFLDALNEALHAIDDLLPAAVAEGQDQCQLGVVSRHFDRAV